MRVLNQAMTGDIVVRLRGGVYALTATWLFNAQDSGSHGHRVIYEAAPNERPIISGGQVVSGWTTYDSAKNIWRADIGRGVRSRQLFVNGRRAIRARGAENPPGFRFVSSRGYDAPHSAMSSWRNQDDIEIVDFNEWKSFRCGVSSISGRAITMDTSCWTQAQRTKWRMDQVTWIENAFELLDDPGEFYIDPEKGHVYYVPRAGETLATAYTVIPRLEQLISATGSLDAPIEDITFRGLTFSYNTWLRPSSPEGYPTIQAGFLTYGTVTHHVDAIKTLSAVSFSAAKRIRLEGNVFGRLGSAGVDFERGSQDNSIIGNRFEDLSGAAIHIGHVNDHHPADPRQIVRNNSIRNNLITRAGQEFHDAVGIWVGYTEATLIAHNELDDLPYSGISIGWGWNCMNPGGACGWTTPTVAKNNRIERNRITNAMKVLRDGGAIYTLGSQPGSVIDHNYVHRMHNVHGGIYLDEGTRHYSVTNNVVSNAANWVYIWTKTISDNLIAGNFSDATAFRDDGTDNTFRNNRTGLRAWPPGAQAIINAAGLESGYTGLWPPSLAGQAAAAAGVTSPD